jgi:hypothetical protein
MAYFAEAVLMLSKEDGPGINAVRRVLAAAAQVLAWHGQGQAMARLWPGLRLWNMTQRKRAQQALVGAEATGNRFRRVSLI